MTTRRLKPPYAQASSPGDYSAPLTPAQSALSGVSAAGGSSVAARQLAVCALMLGLSASTHAAITGQWSFEEGDIFFSGKIGQSMDYLDFTQTPFNTQFGTTTAFGIGNINGQVASPMNFPKTAAGEGFVVPTGAAPNGGGNNINQYTIIMDVYYTSAASGTPRALFQTDTSPQVNANAEFFINSLNQVGTDGGLFSSVATVTPDAWHRVAFAVDLTIPSVAKFIDGVKVDESSPSSGVDGRFSINGTYLYFDNDDNNETAAGYLNSLQFRDERVPDALIVDLGAPTAGGILTGPPPNPYVSTVTPSPQSAIIPARSTVPPTPLIQATIVDGTNALDPLQVSLTLNGQSVIPIVDKVADTTTVGFTPSSVLGSLSLNTVRVTYKGLDGTTYNTQWQFVVGGYVGLPVGSGAPLGSANTPGFLVRTVQAPSATVVPNVNSFPRAIRQLNGTLTDTGGVVVANVAIPGPNADGSYDDSVINYHIAGGTYGAFPSDSPFPGIPGSDGGLNVFATEVRAFLQLTAGSHRLGVSVSVGRVDTETDDGFTLYGGADARDILSTAVGSFARNTTCSFCDAPNFNEFTVVAPADGIYSFRLVHYQTAEDSSLEFYSMVGTNRILINSGDPDAITAYRFSTADSANKPYLAQVDPAAGVSGVSPLLPIQALIIDDQTQVDPNSVQLSLNGVAVPSTATHVGGRTTVFYQPNATRTEVTNRFHLVYADNASPTPNRFTNDWQFTIQVSTVGQIDVTGQWDFYYCDLSPTIGQPLEYFDGAAGQTATHTRFGTTTSFGIPDINGAPASVMFVPGNAGVTERNIGYIMRPGIGANGGGTRVNQYTLVMDIYWPPGEGEGFASFINYDLGNTSDGDIFFRTSDGGFGQGGGGYEGNTVMHIGQWHRVAFAVDMAANPPVVTKFLDGKKHTDQFAPNNGLDGDRRTMQVAGAVLFGEGDGDDERRSCYVNSIQVRAGKLSDAELAALGGPSADKIPLITPQSTVTGQWDFDFPTGKNELGATVGADLQYFDGPAGQTATHTTFGTTTSYGIPDINGVPAAVMFVPGNAGVTERNIGYIMNHLIPANGGGSRVNQYTLVMDIYWPPGEGEGFASFINFDLGNTSDGDIFFRTSDGGFGQGGGGYEGNTVMHIGQWHRVAFAVDMAASPPVVTKFLDGKKHTDQTAPNNVLDGDRRTMQVAGAVLFGEGDGDDERRSCYVNSIQVRAGKLSDAELAALGPPSASGIPVALAHTDVTGQWDFDFPTGKNELGATVGADLQYFDGAAGQTATHTTFGTTTSYGIPDIGGVPATVMFVPSNAGVTERNIGYIMNHLIPANGGGTRVNQYTLTMDLYWPSGDPEGFASFINFDLGNTSDGDFFLRTSDQGFGQGGGGYEGATHFTLNAWHRVSFAVDMAASQPVVTKYLDGVKHADQLAPNNVLDGDRRTMQLAGAVLFGEGDGDDERRSCYVNSIQVRSRKLSDAELAALGAPTASGIPIIAAVAPVITASATIRVSITGTTLRLAWPATLDGYTLQGSPSLSNPNWQTVPSSGNCATVSASTGNQFFRLIK